MLVLIVDVSYDWFFAVLDANSPASADCESDLMPVPYDPPGSGWELVQSATWNDDGSQIAFFEVKYDSSEDPIGVQLVVLKNDGTSWVTDRKNMYREDGNELPFRYFWDTALDWQRGGDLLAFSLREGPRSAPVWLYWVDATSGASGPMTVGGVPARGQGPTWSPEGTRLMYFNAQRKIVRRPYFGNGVLGDPETVLGSGLWPDWQRNPLISCSSDVDCGEGELCDSESGLCFVPECGALNLPVCDDFSDCTVDTCIGYQCNFDAAAAAGLICDDGDSCTENDVCNGSGVCKGILNTNLPGCEPPSCGAVGDSCGSGADCCSGLCHPKKKVCK